MSDRRHSQQVADELADAEALARRGQARDAARIHEEVVETVRLAAAIDQLLDDDGPGDATPIR